MEAKPTLSCQLQDNATAVLSLCVYPILVLQLFSPDALMGAKPTLSCQLQDNATAVLSLCVYPILVP
jgi:hypothetical protein